MQPRLPRFSIPRVCRISDGRVSRSSGQHDGIEIGAIDVNADGGANAGRSARHFAMPVEVRPGHTIARPLRGRICARDGLIGRPFTGDLVRLARVLTTEFAAYLDSYDFPRTKSGPEH